MRLIHGVAALLSLTGVAGIAHAEQFYHVQFEIIHDGRVVGSPAIWLQEGRSGSVEVSGAYRLDVAMEPSSDPRYPVGLSAAVALPRAGDIDEVARLSFRVKLNQQASMELVNDASTDVRRRISVTVSEVAQPATDSSRPPV